MIEVDLTVFSKGIHDVVPPDSQFETVASGFEKTEGPVWVPELQTLFFTDFAAEKIYAWHPEDGVRVFREQSNRAVGLALDSEGRIIACEGVPRRVTRTEQNGEITTVASHYDGKRLNSPNDVVVKSDGSVYFTDPRSRYLTDEQELDFNGVFKVNPTDGQVDLLTAEFQWPNGLCFSPDEMLLYVNDTSRQHIKVYDMLGDGTIHNGRVFCELDKTHGKGAPDGMKVDTEGRVYVTGPGGVWIIDAAGTPLGIIRTPESVLNIGFAGSTLYLTAQSQVLGVALQVEGI